jgi:hypothetical protein
LNGESKNDESDSAREMARDILQYLLEHPDAKDTPEGIAQWWLLKQWAEQRVVDVQRAISVLLSNDLIVETRREGSSPHYGINRQKESEITEMLKRD